MKKLIAFVLTAMITCLAFTGCGKKGYDDLAIFDLGLPQEYFGIAFRDGSDLTRMVEEITLDLIDEGFLANLSDKYQVAAVESGAYTPAAAAYTGSGDWEYVKNKGKLVVGITDYKPMDYKENGKWVGFDAEYALAVAEKLGVEVEFKEIEWEYKLVALEAKDIDCIWNGMTITTAIENAADCTVPYMYNTQVAVVQKANAEKFKSIDDFAGASIAAEGGSAGESAVKDNDALADGLKSVTGQTDALTEVLSGASDAAFVDYILARALIQ